MWEENVVGKDGGMSQLVMVVDDSPTVRRVMEVCLGRAGYEVASFPEGVTALRWLQTPELHLPGLMFLDIEMPGMDGYYVAQYLHARPQYRHIVIVLLSGYNGVLDRLKGSAGWSTAVSHQALSDASDTRRCPGISWSSPPHGRRSERLNEAGNPGSR